MPQPARFRIEAMQHDDVLHLLRERGSSIMHWAWAYRPESEPKPVTRLGDDSSSAFHQVAGAV